MRDYEVMTIHRPELAEDEVEARITDLESHLSAQGATVDGRDLWGKRRFASPAIPFEPILRPPGCRCRSGSG